MDKHSKLLVVAAFVSIWPLFSCLAEGKPTPCWQESPNPSKECIDASIKECEEAHGQWGGIELGMGQIPGCNLPTKDGGKPCKDSSECEGGCIGESHAADKGGHCYQWKTFKGCGMIVRSESGVGVLCID